MGSLVVVLVDEVLEFGLLLQQIVTGWFGGGLFEGQMPLRSLALLLDHFVGAHHDGLGGLQV
jgi:hypothetical protein